MRRPSRKKWRFQNSDFDESLALAAELGVSVFAAQLLTNRGIKTAAEARTYLYPTFDQLHSPFKIIRYGQSRRTDTQSDLARRENLYLW